MELLNRALNLVVPPASLMMMAFAWPTLYFISCCEWIYTTYFNRHTVENKVVVITGASSGIGEVDSYHNPFTFPLFFSPLILHEIKVCCCMHVRCSFYKGNELITFIWTLNKIWGIGIFCYGRKKSLNLVKFWYVLQL